MKERDVERAFNTLGMEEVLRESRETYEHFGGNQKKRRDYAQRANHLNPPLSKNERRSRRRRDRRNKSP